MLDESGEPTVADNHSGINFPSNDGFPINMDFTAIWGLMPDQAAAAVKQFGNIEAVETKFVVPQIESICRNLGSTKGAVELLVGESRQKFQIDTSLAFQKVMKEKNVTLLYGLVRHIYIPTEVRIPIQNANIADEMKLTREQEQITAKDRSRSARSRAQGRAGIAARVRPKRRSSSPRTIGRRAQRSRGNDRPDRATGGGHRSQETAELEAAGPHHLPARPRATPRRCCKKRTADKFRLAVEAFGTGEAYNNWVFASSLPKDIKLESVLCRRRHLLDRSARRFRPARQTAPAATSAIA